MNRKYWIALAVLLSCAKSHSQLFIQPDQVRQNLQNQRTSLLQDRKVLLGFNLGTAFTLGKNNLSELRFNFSLSASRAFGHPSWEYAHVMGSYQLQIECFRGGVGSSLLGGNRSQFVWDLRNVFQLNGGDVTNNPVKGRPLNKLIGTSESPLKDPYDYSIGLGTMFINGLNHNRNQQVGFISVGVLEGSLCYLNDGPFFHTIGLGDGYDRWWTGAGYLGFYFQNDRGLITDIALQYQRYTGWQPNLYEMTNSLGIDYLSYRDKKEQFFNQGAWIWTTGFRNMVRMDVKIYEPKKTDIQNLLHIGNSYTFHPNILKRRTTIGGGLMLNGFTPINE